MVTHPFPYLLKQERNRRRWSQQDLANALKVSRVTVSRWETGEHRPIPYWRERICKLFNKETEEFFPEEFLSDTSADVTENSTEIHRLELQEKRLELQKKTTEYIIETTNKMISILDAQCDANTRTYAIDELLLHYLSVDETNTQGNLLPTLENVKKALEAAREKSKQQVQNALQSQGSHYLLDALEQERCRKVMDYLTKRQQAMLRAIAQGMTPREACDMLCIMPSTGNSHLTKIYLACYEFWELPWTTRINYHFLQKHFNRYFTEKFY